MAKQQYNKLFKKLGHFTFTVVIIVFTVIFSFQIILASSFLLLGFPLRLLLLHLNPPGAFFVELVQTLVFFAVGAFFEVFLYFAVGQQQAVSIYGSVNNLVLAQRSSQPIRNLVVLVHALAKNLKKKNIYLLID